MGVEKESGSASFREVPVPNPAETTYAGTGRTRCEADPQPGSQIDGGLVGYRRDPDTWKLAPQETDQFVIGMAG